MGCKIFRCAIQVATFIFTYLLCLLLTYFSFSLILFWNSCNFISFWVHLLCWLMSLWSAKIKTQKVSSYIYGGIFCVDTVLIWVLKQFKFWCYLQGKFLAIKLESSGTHPTGLATLLITPNKMSNGSKMNTNFETK